MADDLRFLVRFLLCGRGLNWVEQVVESCFLVELTACLSQFGLKETVCSCV